MRSQDRALDSSASCGKNCRFNASVTMTPIKRRKRQKFGYCIFACKKILVITITTMSEDDDIGVVMMTWTWHFCMRKYNERIVTYPFRWMHVYCSVMRRLSLHFYCAMHACGLLSHAVRPSVYLFISVSCCAIDHM